MSERYELITKNLQETLGSDELKDILTSSTDPVIYWGTATTGKPHIAYFLPLLKIRDFLVAKCTVKILLADIHAVLDNLKAPLEVVAHRSKYYEILIKSMLKSINVNIDNLQFVLGSSFQTSSAYTLDLYKLSTFTTEHDAKKAGSQVVKQVKNPLLSALIYPAMQALDEEYLKCDVQFGGVDQRKIFTYAMKYLPMIGYKKRIHLMTPMIPGLNSEKMSASDTFSKIDFCDTKIDISKKIKKCFCEEGNIENNGLLAILKYIIFPIKCEIKKEKICMERRGLETLEFENYEELEEMFVKKEIHPGDLKASMGVFIDEIISPVREELENYADLIELAYPILKKNKK